MLGCKPQVCRQGAEGARGLRERGPLARYLRGEVSAQTPECVALELSTVRSTEYSILDNDDEEVVGDLSTTMYPVHMPGVPKFLSQARTHGCWSVPCIVPKGS